MMGGRTRAIREYLNADISCNTSEGEPWSGGRLDGYAHSEFNADSRLEGEKARSVNVRSILPVLRRQVVHRLWQVSWLAGAAMAASVSPSPGSGRVALRNAIPALQWRDRAGISPDFPIKPLQAPKTINK